MSPTSPTLLRGRVWKFGDWVSGDNGVLKFSELRNFADEHDPQDLAQRCFADLVPDFAQRVSPGDIVVAGRGFGIPSHPPVPVAIRASGISVVVVESTDSAFIRRSLNAGLPVLTCPGITDLVADGDTLQADLESGHLLNVDSGADLSTKPFSPAMLEVLLAGGLVPYLERYLAEENHARPEPSVPSAKHSGDRSL